jgi:hypothetical protein
MMIEEGIWPISQPSPGPSRMFGVHALMFFPSLISSCLLSLRTFLSQLFLKPLGFLQLSDLFLEMQLQFILFHLAFLSFCLIF